jgi:hypothetical protein
MVVSDHLGLSKRLIRWSVLTGYQILWLMACKLVFVLIDVSAILLDIVDLRPVAMMQEIRRRIVQKYRNFVAQTICNR